MNAAIFGSLLISFLWVENLGLDIKVFKVPKKKKNPNNPQVPVNCENKQAPLFFVSGLVRVETE